MKHGVVKIQHIKRGEDVEGVYSKTARIWINGVELEGITHYWIDAGMDMTRGGVVQQMTVEFYANVTVEYVEGEA